MSSGGEKPQISSKGSFSEARGVGTVFGFAFFLDCNDFAVDLGGLVERLGSG